MRIEDVRIELALRQISDIPVLRVVGEIDVYTAPEFKSALNKTILTGAGHLVIDLTEVSYMDSSGFGALLSATKQVRPKGGTVNLVGCSEAVQRMLKITSLDTVFGMFPCLDDALESISPGFASDHPSPDT